MRVRWGATGKRVLTGVWRAYTTYQRFVRLSTFGLSAMMPLLGAATVNRHLDGRHIWGMVAVAFAFHQFGYVLNDVVDLPVDRRQPRRASYPLVSGLVTPRQALAFALLQIPVALLLNSWLGGSGASYLALLIAFALGAVYDLFGKRTAVPPLLDAVQAGAWVSMIFYGTAVAGAAPTPLTWTLAGFVATYIILVNGGHGALRDVRSDVEAGVRTTAILLGARADGCGRLYIPRRLAVYMLLLQLLASGLILWLLASDLFAYAGVMHWGVGTVIPLLQFACIWLTVKTVRAREEQSLKTYAYAYIVLALVSLILLFLPYLTPPLRTAVLITYFAPLVVFDTFYGTIESLWHRLGA
ncbi:MAG: UbiA prenyltransferase family protein [Anaerolineae bacterium]